MSKRMIDSELIDSLKRGELKPIAEYRFATGKLRNYGTFEGQEEILILGLEDDVGDYKCIGLGDFTLENQQVSNFAITGFDYYNDDIMHFTLNNEGKIDAVFYASAADTQNKLYRHIITLRASSSADGTCRLEWISSDSLQCRSLEDLRTVLGNPQMQSYVATNPSGDLFGVVISPSTAQLKKVGATSLANITSVSDTVTAL